MRTPIERRDHARDEHEQIRCGYCNQLLESEDTLVKHVKATHWNRSEIRRIRKKPLKMEVEKVEEQEESAEGEEEERADDEEEEEEEMEGEEEEDVRQISISLLLKLPMRENSDERREEEGPTTLPLGEGLPSEIASVYPQLRSLRVVLPPSLSSSHSLLLCLPLPFDESLAEWNGRTIEIDLRDSVDDYAPIDF